MECVNMSMCAQGDQRRVLHGTEVMGWCGSPDVVQETEL